MAKDFLLGDDDDLTFVGGDLLAGDADAQDVGLILRTYQGEWRQSALVGFGIARRLRSEANGDQLVRDLDTQLRMDGFADIQLALSEQGALTINATRND